MVSKAQLFNLALSVTGARDSVSDPDENSRSAEVCRLWYDTVLESVQRSAPWSSCRRTARLPLKAERDFSEEWEVGDPEPPWRYTYGLPANMLYPRYLKDWQRFQLAVDNTNSNVMYSDVETPILIYNVKQTDISRWDASLRMAIIYALAAHIAVPIHGKLTRAQLTLERANEMILDARVLEANSIQAQIESSPDWLRHTGYSQPRGPFLYPYGPTLTLSSVGTSNGSSD